jgi:hypothetical protein
MRTSGGSSWWPTADCCRWTTSRSWRAALPGGAAAGVHPGGPGRRYGEFTEILGPIQGISRRAAQDAPSSSKRCAGKGHRLVVAHDPARAREQTRCADKRIAALEKPWAQLADKLDAQDAGEVHRGRKLSDSGAKARFFHEVAMRSLARIIKVDLKSELFAYEVDHEAPGARATDGRQVAAGDQRDRPEPAEGIVSATSRWPTSSAASGCSSPRSRSRRCSTGCPSGSRRTRACASWRLILYRVMRQRLKLAGSRLRRIQHHRIAINETTPVTGVSTIHQQQAEVLAALKVAKPPQDAQMSAAVVAR